MITLTGLRQFLDNLEEGILFFDQKRRDVSINEPASRMLVQNHETTLNKLCPSLFQGTACARSCEKRGYCTLMDNAKQGKRSEEHTSELQSQFHLVCRLLLEKNK